MPDHPTLTAGPESWASVFPDLLAHITEQVSGLLPPHFLLTAAGGQVLLLDGDHGHRVIASETVGLRIPCQAGTTSHRRPLGCSPTSRTSS